MKRNLKTYLDLMGMSTDYLPISCVTDILQMAIKDGVTQLVTTQGEYEIIQRWMVHGFQWNWDKKTFMGMEFLIEIEK